MNHPSYTTENHETPTRARTKKAKDPAAGTNTQETQGTESISNPPRDVATDDRYLAPGAKIKHYVINRLLGRGGTADVFLAWDTKLQRYVALKRPFLRNMPTARRLLAEARILAHLRHANVVTVYEVDQFLRHPHMALEYVEGQTLRSILQQKQSSERLAFEVMIPVVHALVHVHQRNVIHRDLKPENIIVAPGGIVKLIDFGVAQIDGVTALTGQTRGRKPIGTLRYMSPEQMRGDVLDDCADLWACGILLHELACGEHPFAPFPLGWERNVADLDEPASTTHRELLSGGVAEVVRQCLQKRREKRIRTAEELLALLEKMAPAGVIRKQWF